MLLGIGFLTVITAAITSTFVAQAGRRRKAESGDPSAEQLTRIDERLERIEAAAGAPVAPPARLRSAAATH